jgi:hypothetical protein
MAETNVPPITFTPGGVVVPTEADILAGRQTDIDQAFGGGVNPGLSTPQGQIAQSDTAIIGDKNDQFLFLANNFDPAYASGRFQDALGRIYFLERLPPTPTVVSCLCVGAPSTIIPFGALATDGVNQWAAVAGGVIPSGGSITLDFACTVDGPIPCPSNSVNQIFRTVLGWDTINNPSAGVEGTLVEGRADFERRRQLSVEQNSRSMIQSVIGAVLNVPNVIDAYGYSNNTASPITIGSVTIPANCIFVCVAGGDPQAVANAIWSKIMPGCAMYGSTSETVYDTSNGYVPPYPSYTINFQTAASLAIKVAVTITNSAQVPSNVTALVQAAVQAAFSGADGGPRARIGSELYASRYYAGVIALGAWAQLVSIKIGTSSATLDDLLVPIDHIPTLQNSDITVTLV